MKGKYYVVTRFYDSGRVSSEILTAAQMAEKSWVVGPGARNPESSTIYHAELSTHDMYIDEFSSLRAAREFVSEADAA